MKMSLKMLAIIIALELCMNTIPFAFSEGEVSTFVQEEQKSPKSEVKEESNKDVPDEKLNDTETAEPIMPDVIESNDTEEASSEISETPEPEDTENTSEPVEPVTPQSPIAKKQVHLSEDMTSVKIFAEPDSASKVVGSAVDGDIVDVFDVEGKWTKISKGGTKGYIVSEYLGAIEESAAEDEQVEESVPSDQTEETTESAESESPIEPEQALKDLIESTESEDPTESEQSVKEPIASTKSEEPIETEESVETADEEVPHYTYTYERDENGNLLLDEEGNPIAVLPENATMKPVAW